jgi:hypothetical protein
MSELKPETVKNLKRAREMTELLSKIYGMIDNYFEKLVNDLKEDDVLQHNKSERKSSARKPYES